MALFVGVFFVFSALIAYPYTVKASLFSFVAGFFGTSADASEIVPQNSQNVSLLKAATNLILIQPKEIQCR